MLFVLRFSQIDARKKDIFFNDIKYFTKSNWCQTIPISNS